MKRGTIAAGAVAAAAAAVVLVAGSAPAEDGARRGLGPESFAFGIGNRTLDGSDAAVGQRFADFDLAVVDGQEAKPGQIAAMQAQGAEVLGYLSVGTIEKWRPWYREVKRYRLAAWQDWKDEWYADTSKAGLRRALVEIADERILDKGFDGLFLDNVDMVEVAKHRKQRAGMGRLVGELDSLVGPARLLFAQNGARGVLNGYEADGVEPLIDDLDGWNREDVTWTYDFDRRRYVPSRAADRSAALEELEEIAGAGLITTATDYVDIEDGFSAAECEAVANAEGVGALPYLANIGLTAAAVEVNPPDC